MDTSLFHEKQLSKAEVAQYREQGYLLIGRTLTDLGIEKMRAEVMAAWNAEKAAFDADKTWLQNSLLSNIHHKSDTVRKYYFAGPLVDIATQVVGPNIKGATSQLTFKMRGNTKPFPWHQDNNYGQLDPHNAISCLTSLDDADVANGCLWIVPASHKRGQIAYTRTVEDKSSGREVKLDVDESTAIPMPMKAGECLFFHCHTLHKSEPNLSKDRDRRILFLRYADADAIEVYNDGKPRLGRLLRGSTRFEEVRAFEGDMAFN